MSYMTCPTCQTDDDVKVMHGSPPRDGTSPSPTAVPVAMTGAT